MLAGALLLWYCSAGYASRVPTWSLPSDLVLHVLGSGDFLGDEVVGLEELEVFGLEELEAAGRESDLPKNIPFGF